MSDCPMLISNKLHSFRNFEIQSYTIYFIDTNDKTDDAIDNLDYMVIGNFLIRW